MKFPVSRRWDKPTVPKPASPHSQYLRPALTSEELTDYEAREQGIFQEQASNLVAWKRMCILQEQLRAHIPCYILDAVTPFFGWESAQTIKHPAVGTGRSISEQPTVLLPEHWQRRGRGNVIPPRITLPSRGKQEESA